MERDVWVGHGLLPLSQRDLKILPLNLACQTIREAHLSRLGDRPLTLKWRRKPKHRGSVVELDLPGAAYLSRKEAQAA